MIKISAIVTTFNRSASLARTLGTLFRQDLPPDEYEVVVVVDGSTDGTVEQLNRLRPECKLQVILQANQGEAAARDAGLRAAVGEIALFLDDDLICEPNLLSAHVSAHADKRAGPVFGPILLHAESTPGVVSEWLRRGFDHWFANEAVKDEGRGFFFCMGNPNTSAPRELLVNAGGFDHRFLRYDDTDLGFRLWKSGLRFRYQPRAVVYHVFQKRAAKLVRNDFVEDGRAEVRLCRKHPEYRRFSMLRYFRRGNLWKRTLRRAAVRVWPASDVAASIPFWFADRLSFVGPIKSFGVRLLRWRTGVAFFRGAIEEAGSWETFVQEFGMTLRVLAYHHVGDRIPQTWSSLTVSSCAFEQQLTWLAKNGYHTIDTADWLQWVRSGRPLPPRPVLLTFDDGYADLVTNAFPALRRHDMKATTFIVSDHIGQRSSWDLAAGYPALPLMSGEDIREWAGRGIAFGSHTRTHPDLRSMDDAAITSEIRSSKQALSQLVPRPADAFAYPFGSHDRRVRRTIGRHCELAFTVDEGPNTLDTDLHELKRIIVNTESTLLFSLMVRFSRNVLTPFATTASQIVRPRRRNREQLVTNLDTRRNAV